MVRKAIKVKETRVIIAPMLVRILTSSIVCQRGKGG